MKKASGKVIRKHEMRPEYDFSGGVRGKHYQAMRAGYRITIRRSDGSVVVKEVMPREDAVILEPDVLAYFPDSKSVNIALRSLIRLFPARRTSARGGRRAHGRRPVAHSPRAKSVGK